MTPVFLDTVGLIALWDVTDQWHPAAESVFDSIVADKRRTITTPQVLLECANSAARRPYRTDVDDLRQVLEKQGDLILPTDREWQQAWDAYRRGQAGLAGVIDLLSFEVMHRHGLTDAFTNDRHYRAAGFKTLF